MPVYDDRADIQEQGMDLVAARDGVVTYMITRSGVPCVSCGDSVQKGDILVSGAVPVYNEDATVRKYQYVEADADITLCYGQNISLEESVAYDEKCYTGEKIDIPVFGSGEKQVSCAFLTFPTIIMIPVKRKNR